MSLCLSSAKPHTHFFLHALAGYFLQVPLSRCPGKNTAADPNLLLAARAPVSRFPARWRRSTSRSAARPCGPAASPSARGARMKQTCCSCEAERCRWHSRWLPLWGWSRPSSDIAHPNPACGSWRRAAGWWVYLGGGKEGIRKLTGWKLTETDWNFCIYALSHYLFEATFELIC